MSRVEVLDIRTRKRSGRQLVRAPDSESHRSMLVAESVQVVGGRGPRTGSLTRHSCLLESLLSHMVLGKSVLTRRCVVR